MYSWLYLYRRKTSREMRILEGSMMAIVCTVGERKAAGSMEPVMKTIFVR